MQYNVLAEGRFFVTTGKRENLGRLLGINDLVRLYKSVHKISSIYWVYNLCKGFINYIRSQRFHWWAIRQEVADDSIRVPKLALLGLWQEQYNFDYSAPMLPQKPCQMQTETIVALFGMVLMYVVDSQIIGCQE
jgi:hypothetical protein